MSDFVIKNGVLVKYTGKGGDVVIPDDVVEIGKDVFYRNKEITAITLPQSVERGGYFAGCSNLRIVVNYGKVHALEYGTTKSTILVEGFLPGENFSQLRHTEYKVNGAICYLSNRKNYPQEETPAYEKYIKSQISNLVTEMINRRAIKAINGLLEMKVLKPQMIQNAIELAENDPEIKAIFMDYQNETVDIKKEHEKEQKRLEKKLLRTEPTVAELKKLWSTAELEDGTLEITSYKGNEEEVVVPEKIGKKAVSSIGKWAFKAYKIRTQTLKNKDRRLDDIKTIIIPEGIRSIGFYAFEDCQGLKDVFFPSSMNDIYYHLFSYTYLVDTVIHAPSGSYAETYAKENNMKFEPIGE